MSPVPKKRKAAEPVRSATRAKPVDVKAAMLKTLGPVEPGLIVVVLRDATLQSMARAALERQLRLGRKSTGLVLPKGKPVLSLYAGSTRKASEAQALALAQSQAEGAADQKFQSVGTRDGFVWCADEGLCALLPIIENAEGWVTASQVADSLTDANLVDAFSRIRTAAKEAEAFVMLFMLMTKPREGLRVQDFCDDYVVVDRCDPDPGKIKAFSVECHGLADLHDLGIGKSMCSVALDDSRYTWAWESFVSANVLDRVIWKLRSEERSLSDIAKIVRRDKATVHRHLEAMPPILMVDLPKHWLKRYVDTIDLDTGKKPGEVTPSDDVVDEVAEEDDV